MLSCLKEMIKSTFRIVNTFIKLWGYPYTLTLSAINACDKKNVLTILILFGKFKVTQMIMHKLLEATAEKYRIRHHS